MLQEYTRSAALGAPDAVRLINAEEESGSRRSLLLPFSSGEEVEPEFMCEEEEDDADAENPPAPGLDDILVSKEAAATAEDAAPAPQPLPPSAKSATRARAGSPPTRRGDEVSPPSIIVSHAMLLIKVKNM